MSISGGSIGNKNHNLQQDIHNAAAAAQVKAGDGAAAKGSQDVEIAKLLARAGVGQIGATDSVATTKEVSQSKQLQTAVNVVSKMSPPMPPVVKLTPELKSGAESFSNNLDIALTDVTSKGSINFQDMNSQMMTSAFLKLNIMDPNNSVETHNELAEAMSTLRQKAIDDGQC